MQYGFYFTTGLITALWQSNIIEEVMLTSMQLQNGLQALFVLFALWLFVRAPKLSKKDVTLPVFMTVS